MRIALLIPDNREVWKRYAEPAPIFGQAPAALLSGFMAMPELEVHVLSCVRQPVAAPTKLADNVWFHALHVPRLGWIRTGYQGCIRAMRSKLREIKPDLVHGQGTELESGICAAFSSYPNVITLLGVMREMKEVLNARPGSFYWMASLMESLALQRTSGVVANSNFTEACVRHRTPQTWLVPNALRQEFLNTPIAASSKRTRNVVLNIGTIVEYKRQNELIDVAEKLRVNGVDVRLQFVGAATPGTAYVDRFLERIRNKDWVTWHKSLSTSEVIAALDQAGALVHVSGIESFGLVVAEALARNVKFIGFGVAGVNDIVKEVEGAEVFGDGDWAGITSAIAGWARAGHPRPTQAAATMRERYAPMVVARKHLDIYRQVLQNQRAQSL
ncbi:MAG: hypothetical protein RLY20_1594 [Verrucomicrobiota bacterium]|jgi:glycosyltransferase involved in cell wall biosynthesis